MHRMIRSLFLLSLSAAPLAVAATPAKALTTPATEMTAAASDSPSVQVGNREVGLVRTQLLELETTLNGMRRELAQIREQEDARTRVIGDPNVHSLWP